MDITALVIITGLLLYAVFYFCYGLILEKKVVGGSTAGRTPAQRLYDGFDYVPTRKQVLFGHHFASIAGIAPIVGPALALCWGWIPALAWVWFGNVCIGAVHDYLSLMVSLRYDGKSIQYVASDILGKRTGRSVHAAAFCLLVLLIAILAAFLGRTFQHNPAIASTFIWTTLSAVFLGVFLYRIKRVSLFLATVLGILMLLGSIWLGILFPVSASCQTWLAVFFFYLIVVSALPVHTILQPRDYLNSFLLYAGLLVGFLAAATSLTDMVIPAFTQFSPPLIHGKPTPLWPLLPVIITGGALSGFHSLVSAGTSSKELSKESEGLLIGYGGMLVEGFLATIVVVSIGGFGHQIISSAGNIAGAALSPDSGDGGLSFAFVLEGMNSTGLGLFIESYTRMVDSSLLGFIPTAFVKLMAGLWVASFAMTAMDTANRIGRYCIEEMTQALRKASPLTGRILSNRFNTSLIPAALGISLALWGGMDMLWSAFGAANLCIAVFVLFTATLYLRRGSESSASSLVSIPAWLMWITATAALLWCSVLTALEAIGRMTPEGWIAPGIFILLLIMNVIVLTDYILAGKGESTVTEQ